MTNVPAPMTIRPAYADDALALARLAALDSADRLPARPVLLAEVDGELRAALSLSDGTSIADPFHRTAEIVGLLRAHAEAAVRSRPEPRQRQRRRLSYSHG